MGFQLYGYQRRPQCCKRLYIAQSSVPSVLFIDARLSGANQVDQAVKETSHFPSAIRVCAAGAVFLWRRNRNSSFYHLIFWCHDRNDSDRLHYSSCGFPKGKSHVGASPVLYDICMRRNRNRTFKWKLWFSGLDRCFGFAVSSRFRFCVYAVIKKPV